MPKKCRHHHRCKKIIIVVPCDMTNPCGGSPSNPGNPGLPGLPGTPGGTRVINNSPQEVRYTIAYDIIGGDVEYSGMIPGRSNIFITYPGDVDDVALGIENAGVRFNPQIIKTITYNPNGTITAS